jgi:hypothetical protein
MKAVKIFAVAMVALVATTSVKAQFSVGADLVSSYVWRGVPQDVTFGGTPNIQPFVTYTAGSFTIGSWASSSFTGIVKEVDIYATYAFSPSFSLTVTDYNWGFGNPKGYFNYGKGSDHKFEATLAYTGGESFPISASLNTFFAGSDTLATGKAAFSSYLELSYPISANAKVFCGASLTESAAVYNTSGFAVTNLGVKVSKSIAITDKFSLPVYGVLGANLSTKDATGADKPSSLYFVAGITL